MVILLEVLHYTNQTKCQTICEYPCEVQDVALDDQPSTIVYYCRKRKPPPPPAFAGLKLSQSTTLILAAVGVRLLFGKRVWRRGGGGKKSYVNN